MTLWLLCGALTSAVALGGAVFGKAFVTTTDDRSFVESLCHWDGQHFKHILELGYEYDETHGARIAFFPAFPLAAKAVMLATGCSAEAALASVANVCALVAMVLMGLYLRQRLATSSGDLLPDDRQRARQVECYALLAMGLFPTTFFFRMGYTEAPFLCLAILALYGMVRSWPLVLVALVVGLATAARPVGVALLLPLAGYAVSTSSTRRQAIGRLAYAVPLGCWGLAAFMAYQYWEFEQPFAFALTQDNWRLRDRSPWSDKALSLLSWEPIWGVYTPGTREHDAAMDCGTHMLFNLALANPIYFLGTAALIAVGHWKRWLTSAEAFLSAGLLAIPYVTRGYEFCMQSQGRFAAVVFPAYLVLGHVLARLPMPVAVALLALAGAMMAAYAALFVTAHCLI